MADLTAFIVALFYLFAPVEPQQKNDAVLRAGERPCNVLPPPEMPDQDCLGKPYCQVEKELQFVESGEGP